MVMQLSRPANVEIVRQSAADTARTFNVRHYHEAYSRGMNVSEFMERMDPTSSYDEGSRERGLDAFERVVREAGIRFNAAPAEGYWPSTWEDCLATPERRALMPEMMSRIWRQATRLPLVEKRAVLASTDFVPGTVAYPWFDNPELRAKQLIPPIPIENIVARTTAVDGDNYRSIYVIDDYGSDSYRMKRIGEGAEIPTTTLVTSEHTIRLHKFGRALRATYEQLRRQRIDRIAFIIARMALQAEVDKVAIALGVVINGDGNANTAGVVLANTALDSAAVSGTLTFKSWLTFKLRFNLGYAPNIVIGQEAAILQLLLLPVNTGVGQIPLAMMPGNVFGVVGPINDQLSGGVRYGVTTDAPASKLVAFQSGRVLERVTEIGGNISEVERFVTNQTQILTLTEVEGYGIMDPFGTKILQINA